MSNTEPSTRSKDLVSATYRLASVGVVLGGFTTVIIIGLAILIGLWLDRTFASAKHLFTFVLVLISVPLNIVALLWVARFTTSRFNHLPADSDAQAEKKDLLQEDDNRVGS